MTAPSVEVVVWTYPNQIGAHAALALAAGIAVGHGKPGDPSLSLCAESSSPGLVNVMIVWDDDSEILLRVDLSTWQGALRLLLVS
ncbi:MAG: hypothetical protein E6R03_13955 [Hyphomicrobiaceae bacterium]|nr:MAG: hypothetical protein E6R03_13955 [Hyphomicrobiaceae bacterium]